MKDVTIFGDMTLGDLLQDIYVGTMQKRNRINKIITLMEGMLTNVDDIAVIGPILNHSIDVLVKNDDHLIKIATIVQRVISAENYGKNSGDVSDILTQEEKDTLTKMALDELNAEMVKVEKELADIAPKLKDTPKNG
jgi:hypothetical protein